jgi:hypothetical protein
MGREPVTSCCLIGPHEGDELDLMLSGVKPLSLFTFVTNEGHEFAEAAFDDQVSTGKLVKRVVHRQQWAPHGNYVEVTTVLYSLSDQIWRIDAYLFIAELYRSLGVGYRPDLERMIGNLLGYRPEAIEAFIDRVRLKGLCVT